MADEQPDWYRCECGFSVWLDDPAWWPKWEAHITRCKQYPGIWTMRLGPHDAPPRTSP